MYLQLAERLRTRITSGELQPGELMPTEREVAQEANVSRATAAKALEVLEQEGLLTTGHSRAGRRVRRIQIMPVHASRTESLERRRAAGVDAWVADAKENGREPGQTIDVGLVSADETIASKLGLDPGETVVARRRMRTLDGEPSNMADTFYPMSVAQAVPGIMSPADVQPGVIALMAEHGYELTHFVDELRWRPPTPDEAHLLRIGQGTAVLIQWRTGYIDNEAVHLTRTIWPGDSIALIFELPA
ncbi:GntR family transcriptional regulator [Nocardiopsis sp. NPDC055824]